jgi:acetate kinase
VLLFDVTSRSAAWCHIGDAERIEGEAASFDDAFPSVERRLGTLRNVGSVGYLLRHGGTTVKRPVSRLGTDTLLAIQRCSRFLPEDNDALYRVADRGLSVLPEATHLLFCDTAFFADLPEHVSAYAIPHSLAEPSLRRCGGFGLCHQWVWESLQGRSLSPPSAVVSVDLGEVPNVAAIQDGKAAETTIGFTSVEGISSARSSGDIDPTILFELHAAGYGLNDAARMLSEQSGFSAWLGRDCTLAEIARGRGDDPQLFEARECLLYQIRKAVGALVAVLGGVDAIACVSEDLPSYSDFIVSLSQQLSFLSVYAAPDPRAPKLAGGITRDNGRVPLYSLHYDKWQVLFERGRALLQELRPPQP